MSLAIMDIVQADDTYMLHADVLSSGIHLEPDDQLQCWSTGKPQWLVPMGKPQLLSPPDPAKSLSPSSEYDPVVDSLTRGVSISTTFYPDAGLLPHPIDLVLVSSDGVLFSVHTIKLTTLSANRFNRLLLPKHKTRDNSDGSAGHYLDVLPLPDVSSVLNVVLHAVYGLPCEHYHPSLEILVAAVDALATYGLSPKRHVAPSMPLYTLLLNRAPLQPIAVYALAAAHSLCELAVAVSSHLLSYQLSALTDDLALRMGPLYVKRLFFLHLGRLDALRRLLLGPPRPHPPTATCDFAEQKRLARAWTLASAYLAWEARPDTTVSAIEHALCPLAKHLACDVCKRALLARVKELITQWSMVKRSI